MNKSWIAIGLGSLVIIGVMVFLTIKGVSHREHTFIKWSKTDNPDKMGEATMKRLFPILKENSAGVDVIGDTPLSPDFITGFSNAAGINNLPVNIAPGTEIVPEKVSIQLKQITVDMKPPGCGDKPRDECIYIKAQRSWHKKERDPSKYWFLLQWVANNQFHLYFTPPRDN